MENFAVSRLVGVPPEHVGFEDGRLTDGQGRSVDSRNPVVLPTSNIAST